METKLVRFSDFQQYHFTPVLREDGHVTIVILKLGNNGHVGNISYNGKELWTVNQPIHKEFDSREDAMAFMEKIVDGASSDLIK